MRPRSHVLMWTAGLAATAALVHLFDPVSGRHRRRMIRENGVTFARRLGKGVIVAQISRFGVRRALRRAAAHF